MANTTVSTLRDLKYVLQELRDENDQRKTARPNEYQLGRSDGKRYILQTLCGEVIGHQFEAHTTGCIYCGRQE